MKKLFVFAMVAAGLTIFNGCQKEELNVHIVDEIQSQNVVTPDVYVKDDYLVFKDFETYDSIAGLLNNGSLEYIKEFETKLGFKSAFTYLQENMEKLNTLDETESITFLNFLSKEGYFNLLSREFTYPFYNETRAVILNPDGKFQIGKTVYQFDGYIQTVSPDLTGIFSDVNKYKITKELDHQEQIKQLKSATILFDNTTSGGQQRLTMRVLREYLAAYDWIIEDGEIVWGIVGYHWEVSLRFHSWRQRTLSKTDENTYFHWIANQFTIGGNNTFWYYNYSNLNTETSPWKAIYYLELYDSGLTQETIYPTTNVDADCWSDRLSTPINWVYYTD